MNKAAKLWATLLVIAASGSSAQTVTPTFDMTGVWDTAGGGTMQIFQSRGTLTMVFVGPDFAHRFVASYVEPTVASGIQVRVTRNTGCSTTMTQTYLMDSPDFIRVRATALDSNCDLVKGQVIFNSAIRVF